MTLISVEVYGITKEYHFLYKWKTKDEANQICQEKGLRLYSPSDTLVHKKVHELVQTLKLGQYWINADWTTDFRNWNDNEPKNLNQCVVGGLKNAKDETSPYWASFQCSEQAQIICEDVQTYSDPEPVIEMEVNNLKYKIYKQNSGTFQEMTEFCDSIDYQLFEPRSTLDDFMEVYNIAKKNGLGMIWLNLQRKYPGSMFKYISDNGKLEWNNWARMDHNNGVRELCVATHFDSSQGDTWIDVSCNNYAQTICQEKMIQ